MVNPIPTGNSPQGSQEESGQAFEDQTSEGQICAGKYLLQTGSVDGSRFVKTYSPETMPEIQARQTPIRQLPPRFSNFLDRTHEMELAAAALRARPPRIIEFYGPAGTGKTALLSYLAYHPLAAGFRDGVIYLPVEGQPIEDILQTLFNAFYECSIPIRPEGPLLRQALKTMQALILMDDADQPGQDLEKLIEILSDCSILLATSERRLWANGESIAMQGLPVEAAQTLFEGAFGRNLSLNEISPFENLFNALQGLPQSLLQAAALASRTSQSLGELAAGLRSTAIPSQALYRLILTSLSEEECRVIYVLAAVDGAPLVIDHLKHLTQLSNASSILSELDRRAIVQARNHGYILAGNLQAAALNTWDLTQWVRHVSTYFAEWAKAQRQERLLEESVLLLRIQKWSAGIGCWREVLSIARSLDAVLVTSGGWGAWLQALQLGLQAAQNLGERASEAWALHQLGARALCLGNTLEARSFLIRALRLRETCGDLAGAAATRHNLDFFLPVQVRTKPVAAARLNRSQQTVLKPAAAVLLALALLASLAIFVSRANHLSHEIGAVFSTQIEPAAPAGFVTQSVLTSPEGISYLPLLLSGIAPLPTSTPTPWWKSTTPTPLIPFVPYTPATMVLVSVQPIQIQTISPNQPVSASLTQTPALRSCGPPSGWAVYTVQHLDSLDSIASAAGTSVQDLLFANCLNGLTWLTPGEMLYVPRLPVSRTATITVPPAILTPQSATGTTTPTLLPGRTPTSSTGDSAEAHTATPGPCLEFEDLSLYRVYIMGETVLTSGFPITITNFVRGNGIVLNHGDAEVDAVALSGGSGNELIVDSATLTFGFARPVSGLSLLYGEYGGDLSIEINGQARAFNRFSDIHQKTIGGVLVRVNSSAASDRGVLDMVGTVRQFRIGGLEVAVDRVCLR